MKFLIIALSLLLMSRLPLPPKSTQSRTFHYWLDMATTWSKFDQLHHALRWSCVVLPPAVCIALLSLQLDQWLWGLPLVAVEIFLLVYVLSHINIKQALEDYKNDLANGNVRGAMVCAEQFSTGTLDSRVATETNVQADNNADQETIDTTDDQANPSTLDDQSLHNQVIKSLLHRWFEYFFLMVFWYVIADVVGLAVAWASLQFARSPATDGYAWRYLYWIEWLPARLLGLTYALAGDFSQAFPALKQSLTQWFRSSADVLYDLASNALNLNSTTLTTTKMETDDGSSGTEQHFQRLEAWQSLHWRCVSIWMVVLAVASLGGILL